MPLRQIYFVNIFYFYTVGWDKFNNLSDKEKEIFYNAREEEIDYLMEKQFAITYYTNTSYGDVIEMTPFELDNIYNKLIKVKELEAQNIKAD